jgi:hypothetical protein
MGVVAAQAFERRFIDVDGLRSGDPGEVIQRFRKDAHEVVDILLDVAHAASRSLGDVASKAVRLRPLAIDTSRANASSGTMASGALPTLVLPAPIAPGDSSEVMLNVENDTESPTVAFEFVNTDLVDQQGNRIPADQVTFSSQSMSVGPHQAEKVSVRVSVPTGTPAGRYSGLLQASRIEGVRAILLVDIS